MGNNVSEVNDSLKAQAGGAGGPELYKYVNVSGTGELVALMRKADIDKDYTKFDEIVKNVISTYLYNDGKGADVCKNFNLKQKYLNKNSQDGLKQIRN